MMAEQEGAMESYEEALAIYEAAKASAGHTYVPTDAVWAEDNSSVTFTQLECSSVCQERKPYVDCLLEDDTPLAYTVEETTNESTITEVTGLCPDGVTQLYDASGEVEVAEGETVAYTVQKSVALEPADHTYAEGVCQICGDCSVKRVSGEGRVETGIEVADQLKAVLGVEKFDAVILANGDAFADALAGSYLATVKNAPILLHRNSGKGDELNEAYISENLVAGGTIYLLGGTAAIPESVEESLKALGNVVRLKGDTRFDTNLAILEAAGIAADDEILVTTGWEFADCLSASASGKPILMQNTIKGELTETQIAFLEKYAENDFTIIGGTAAVSEEMETAIEAIVGETTRISGSTREETSVKIAEAYFEDPECVFVAYSRNFPDGLCGGPLAYAMNAPLLLVNAGKEEFAAAYVAEEGIAVGYVLGGTAVLTDETVKTVFALPENAVIDQK